MWEHKAALWAVKSKIGGALSDPLPAKQAATLDTTATSIAEEKLAYQLGRWWDIKSDTLNCNVDGHSEGEKRAIKTLEQTTQFNGERYEDGFQLREDEVKTPNQFYTAMVQLNAKNNNYRKTRL